MLGVIIFKILEVSPVANRYLILLEIHGCSQGIEEPAHVTHDSESLIDHLIQNDFQRPLEFGVIKTYITHQFAIYVELDIYQSQSFRSEHFIRDRSFRQKPLSIILQPLPEICRLRTGLEHIY